MARFMLVSSAVLVTAACGGASAPKVPGEEAVVLSDTAPPAGYEKLRELAVTSGKGCGMLGERGSAEGARAEMRRAATKLGAAYVQLTQAEKPPVNHQCMEHAHQLRGVAYRKTEPLPAATSAPAAPLASAPPARPRGFIVQDYEGVETATKPAAATARSKVTLTLAPGDGSRSALSGDYSCSGDEQRADLDVWGTPLISDWTAGNALTLRIKPDAAMSLSVSFMDGNHAGYTQKTELLVAGQWQTVRLPFDKFWFNPFGPPGDVKGAPLDRRNVTAFGFAPQGCTNGHFLIDDFALSE
jgi:hypothetical protein